MASPDDVGVPEALLWQLLERWQRELDTAQREADDAYMALRTSKGRSVESVRDLYRRYWQGRGRVECGLSHAGDLASLLRARRDGGRLSAGDH